MEQQSNGAEVRQKPTATKTRRKSNEQRRVLFTEDVARMVGCSAATIERMRYEGRGPKWIRVGARNIVYREESVLAWLAEQEQGGDRE